MTEKTEHYKKRRAAARRLHLPNDDRWKRELRPADLIVAFNAGFDAGAKPRLYPAGYDPRRPNHYFHDGAGDPSACTEDHNHPED